MDEIIKTALKRFRLAETAEAEIRRNSLEDHRFRAGDQWPANVKTSRDIEMRPCLTINRIPQFVRQVTNDARMNRPSIKIDAVDDDAIETAEVLEGMCRHIQVSSNSDIALDTACDSQVTGGFGYFRLITEYCAEDSFDQDIKIKRIKNPFTVYFDPHCMEPDYSDAKWAFIVSDIPKEDFKASYPKSLLSTSELASTGDNAPGWLSGDSVRIAEYFEIKEEDVKIYLLIDNQVVSDIQGIDPSLVLKERTTKIKKVIWRKITAVEVLEEQEWPGKYIPIVPVLGDDLDIDGKRDLVGMVRYAQDPQRMYNYWSTAQTEAIALAPKAPFVGAEGQFEGYENVWATANTKSYSYLTYKPISIEGVLVPPPQRQMAEPPVQAMVQAIAQASEDLKNTTGIHDASLGARSNETSGKAILARQREGDVSNFHYIDNLSRSIRYLGIILVDLIPKIYDAPRITRIVHEDGSSKMVKINQPSDETDENGVAKVYDVTTGRYDVVVNTGPSYNTKRQESADSMLQLTQAYPTLMQVGGDLMIKNMDWPQAQELAERFKKMLPPELQDNDDNEQQIPPQIQQQLVQAQQMIDQLTQALNGAQDKLDTKALELESKERIALQNNETQLVLKEMDNNMGLFAAELKHINDRLTLLGQDKPIEGGSFPQDQGNPSQIAQ